MLDEGNDAGGMLFFPCISISPLGRITKEGGVPNVVFLLPVPISGIPLELGDESGLKNPIDRRFLPREGEIFGQSERCSVSFLLKHPDPLVPFQGNGDIMRTGCLDASHV